MNKLEIGNTGEAQHRCLFGKCVEVDFSTISEKSHNSSGIKNEAEEKEKEAEEPEGSGKMALYEHNLESRLLESIRSLSVLHHLPHWR